MGFRFLPNLGHRRHGQTQFPIAPLSPLAWSSLPFNAPLHLHSSETRSTESPEFGNSLTHQRGHVRSPDVLRVPKIAVKSWPSEEAGRDVSSRHALVALTCVTLLCLTQYQSPVLSHERSGLDSEEPASLNPNHSPLLSPERGLSSVAHRSIQLADLQAHRLHRLLEAHSEIACCRLI